MAREIFSILGKIGLSGVGKVTTQLTAVDKHASKTSDNMDKANRKTGNATSQFARKLGSTYVAMSGHISSFANKANANLGKYGESLQNTGQKMQTFGAGGKAMLGMVGVSAAGMGMAISGGMKRLDALNGANLTFQAFNAAGDKSFGNVTKASQDMTKGTSMSVSDFAKSVDKYVAKGVPKAAAMATTSLNAFTKGTSVGMTDAAQSTARFNSVGMSLKDSTNTFKDMTRVLAGTGHATSESMETASTAISRMSADGKVNLGDMNQLLNAMPDAMKMLADSTGKSMGELRKSISAGEISYDDFAKAMTNRANEVDKLFEKQGGVMAQTGKSFEGAIGNLKASISRFGATVLESIGQSNITDAIGAIGAQLDKLGATLAPIIKDMVNFGVKAGEMIKPFVPMIASFAAASAGAGVLGGVMVKVGGAMSTFSNNPVLGMLMILTTLLINAYATNETFRNGVNAVVSTMGKFFGVVSGVVGSITDFVNSNKIASGAVDVFKVGLMGVVGAVTAFMAIGKTVQMIKAFKTALLASKGVTVAWTVATKIAAGAQKLFNLAMRQNPIVKVISLIVMIGSALAVFFTQTDSGREIWQSFMDWLKGAWEGIKDFFQGLWDGIVDVFNKAVQFVADVLSSKWGQIGLLIVFPIGGIINVVIQHWEKIKQTFFEAVDAIVAFMRASWDVIKDIVEGTMNIIWSIIQIVWQLIKVVFEVAVGLISQVVKIAFDAIKSVIETTMHNIRVIIETVWGFIGPYVMAVVNTISKVVTTVFRVLYLTMHEIQIAIHTIVIKVWNAIYSVVSKVVIKVRDTVTRIWNNIKDVTTQVFNAVKAFLTSVWNKVKAIITTAVNAIKSAVTKAWNGIKDVTTRVFNAVKTVVTNVWNAIKLRITNVVNAIKSAVTSAWNNIKTITSNVFNAVKAVALNVWNNIKSVITNVVNSIKSVISNVFGTLKSITSNAFNGVKNAAHGIMDATFGKIKGIIDKIKGIFNFRLKFPKVEIPHIKLPHFKLSGSFNPLKGQIPKVGIDWYAKGGIMTKPTIFGMNGNTMMGGGEAGKEAVLPLNAKTLGGIGAGIADQMKFEGRTQNSQSVSYGDVNVTVNGVGADGITPDVIRQIQKAVEDGITKKQNARGRTMGGFA